MKCKSLLVAVILSLLFACSSKDKLKVGNEVAVKVERFRNEKGRLPNSLNEIGIEETESGPIFYERENDTKYILWFGTELGESKTYDSDTKQWK